MIACKSFYQHLWRSLVAVGVLICGPPAWGQQEHSFPAQPIERLDLPSVGGAAEGELRPGRSPRITADPLAPPEGGDLTGLPPEQLKLLDQRTAVDLQHLRTIIETATTAGERARASRELADELFRSARTMPPAASQAFIDQADAYYASSIREARGADRVLAANNYATALLHRGRTEDAAALLASVAAELHQLDDPVGRSRYLFNYGRALEGISDRPGEIVTIYADAFAADDAFVAAAERGLALAYRNPEDDTVLRPAGDLLSALVAAGELQLAGSQLLNALAITKWYEHDDFIAVIDATLEYFTASSLTPSEFEDTWRLYIEQIERVARMKSEDFARKLRALSAAYTVGELPTFFRPADLRGFIGNEHGIDVNGGDSWVQLSQLYQAAGDGFLREEEFKEALSRYAAAWAADTSNTEAALYAANLLMSHQSSLDPTRRFRHILAAELIRREQDVGTNWENILRLHTAIGMTYADENPSQAIRHFEQAQIAYNRLALHDPEALPVPGLHQRLGEVYAELGEADRARAALLAAIDGFATLGHAEVGMEVASRFRQEHLGTASAEERREFQLAMNQLTGYPMQAITIVMPFGVGSLADIHTRLLADHLSEALAQPIGFESRLGAGGMVAGVRVADAAPDGYTLLLGTSYSVAIAPLLGGDVPYDPILDFQPITPVGLIPDVLAVSPVLPVDSLSELLEFAREKPDALTFGSFGLGTPNHLSGELLKVLQDLDLMHVSYPSAASGMAALSVGEVDLMFVPLPVWLSVGEASGARAVSVTGSQRSAVVPEVPTMAEAGVDDFVVEHWWGLLAPRGTPDVVVTRLYNEVKAIVEQREVQEQFAERGIEPWTVHPAEFLAIIEAQTLRWTEFAERTGITF